MTTYKGLASINSTEQLKHLNLILNSLRGDYNDSRLQANRIISLVKDIESGNINVRINSTRKDLVYKELDDVLLENGAIGVANMLEISGKYTVGGKILYLEPEFGINVLNFLDFAHSNNQQVTINEGYRTFKKQSEYYFNYKSGKGGVAASPYTGNHRKGKAVDFNLRYGSSGYMENVNWIYKYCEQFGLYPLSNLATRAKDLVHFSYNGG